VKIFMRICLSCSVLVGCWVDNECFDCPDNNIEDCPNHENCPLFSPMEEREVTSTLCDECFKKARKLFMERRANEEKKKERNAEKETKKDRKKD